MKRRRHDKHSPLAGLRGARLKPERASRQIDAMPFKREQFGPDPPSRRVSRHDQRLEVGREVLEQRSVLFFLDEATSWCRLFEEPNPRDRIAREEPGVGRENEAASKC